MYTDGSWSWPQRPVREELHCQARCEEDTQADSTACKVSVSRYWQWEWKQPHMCSRHHLHIFNVLATKGERWNGKPILAIRHPPSKSPWVHYHGHAWVGGNDHAGRLSVKPAITVGCISKYLKGWRAWDTTYGHKTKTIDHFDVRGIDSLRWKVEKGPLSVRPTLKLFQRHNGKTSERFLSRWAFPSAYVLSWTELSH